MSHSPRPGTLTPVFAPANADRPVASRRMEPLRIHLFGGFLLERGSTVLPPIASRVGRSLFARLVMQRGRPLQREYLAGTFWSELPEGRARRRLSHTLWQIQDVVNEGPISHLTVTPDTLAFDTDTPCWLDVDEFDSVFDTLGLARPGAQLGRTADLAALRRCVELYRGDFLAGFFDDWVTVEQEVYRERYRVALGRLVETTKAHGAYEEALTHARRLTHHDPLREEAHQEVMRLSFLLGRPNDAVQQFERCRSVLSEAIGAEPSHSTTELYRRILAQRRAAVPAPEGERADLLDSRAEVPFVGRVEERRRLVDMFERVLGGGGGVTLVEGEPGIGKTRLAIEVTDDARWRGFEVTWGTCRPGTLRPFAPIAEVLESLSPLRAEQLAERVHAGWLQTALRLAPRLEAQLSVAPSDPAAAPTDPSDTRDALAATLRALGDISPHLIVIDDVQWADKDTLGVLARMGSHLASTRTHLLLLYRSDEGRGDPDVWDTLRELDRVAGLGRVVLSPLSVFELGELVQRVFEATAVEPRIVTSLHRRTGGNALFTLESLQSIRDHSDTGGADGAGAVLASRLADGDLPIADRVRSIVDGRMALLGDEGTAVLEACSAVGDAADIDLLAAGAGLARTTVLEQVSDLLHRRLLADDEGRYRITHDHIRQVVYEGIEAGDRREIHRRLADSLLDSAPDDVEALAYHYSAGGAPDRATTFHLQAAERAERLGAFETAAEHLAAAASWSEEAGAVATERYELLGSLERVLSVLGRRREQETTIGEMADLGVAGTEADLDRRRAWLFAQTGEFERAEACAVRSVSAERGKDGSPGLADSLVALGTCIRWAGRPLDAVPHLRAALEAGSDDRHRAEALTELGSTLVEIQDSAEALSHLEEAALLFRALGDARGEADVVGIQARAARLLGEADRAAELYGEALELCRRIGYRHREGVNLVNLGVLHHLRGHAAEALTAYDEAAELFGELDDRRGQAMVLANAASVRHHLLGDDERSLRDAEKAMGYFASIGDRAREAQCMEIVSGVHLRRGDAEESRRILERSIEILADAGNRFLTGQHLRSLALLHLADQRPLDALEVIGEAEQVSAEAGLCDLAVELTSIRGAALLALGDVDDALAATRLAAERLTPGVESAHLIHYRHALAAHRAGYRDEARAAAGDAVRVLESSLTDLSRDQREMALEGVPEHREILSLWRRLSPRVVQVRLPAAGAPLGRPLAEGDIRDVTWTVDHPDDREVEGRVARRRHRLLRLLDEAREQGAQPSIEDLAEAVDASPSTVGRDLTELREAGHEARTRGGSRAS